MSAIYYDQESEIKANQCKTIVTFDITLESKILNAGNILMSCSEEFQGISFFYNYETQKLTKVLM